MRGCPREASHAADGAEQTRVFQVLELALDGRVSLPSGARDDERDAFLIERSRQARARRLCWRDWGSAADGRRVGLANTRGNAGRDGGFEGQCSE